MQEGGGLRALSPEQEKQIFSFFRVYENANSIDENEDSENVEDEKEALWNELFERTAHATREDCLAAISEDWKVVVRRFLEYVCCFGSFVFRCLFLASFFTFLFFIFFFPDVITKFNL
jgi:hypothetical protein